MVLCQKLLEIIKTKTIINSCIICQFILIEDFLQEINILPFRYL